jgi:hypothetical protein
VCVVICCRLQPDQLTEILEYSNIIFSTLFAIEMLLKVLAYGPLDYLKNGFNVFDGFIVVLRFDVQRLLDVANCWF